MPSTVNLKKFETFDDMLKALSQRVMGGAFFFPGTLFTQGGRQFVTTSVSLGQIAKQVKIDPSPRGEDPTEHMNRMVDEKHAKGIKNYLVGNDTYILPSLTLNYAATPTFYMFDNGSATPFGFVEIPNTAVFVPTDGGHRSKVIPSALDEKSSLMTDGIAVVFSFETDRRQSHQDFADCAKTKPISSSLKATYDTRDARIVHEVIGKVNFFKNRIDFQAQIIRGDTKKVFTMKTIKDSILELIVGPAENIKGNLDRIGTDEDSIDIATERAIMFFEEFSNSNEQWLEVTKKNAIDIDFGDLRKRYVHFSAYGLTILCRAAHSFINDKSLDHASKVALIHGLGKIDWSKENNLWRKTVVDLVDGQFQMNRPSRSDLSGVTARIKILLGLVPTAMEIKQLKERVPAEQLTFQEKESVRALEEKTAA